MVVYETFMSLKVYRVYTIGKNIHKTLVLGLFKTYDTNQINRKFELNWITKRELEKKKRGNDRYVTSFPEQP